MDFSTNVLLFLLLLLLLLFCSHSVEQGGLKDREIKSLRRQLDSRDEELAEMTRGREVALKENRRLQADLNTMTEENQVHFSLCKFCLLRRVVNICQHSYLFPLPFPSLPFPSLPFHFLSFPSLMFLLLFFCFCSSSLCPSFNLFSFHPPIFLSFCLLTFVHSFAPSFLPLSLSPFSFFLPSSIPTSFPPFASLSLFFLLSSFPFCLSFLSLPILIFNLIRFCP